MASLWFGRQAAAYPFAKLCGQLPWDPSPCDIVQDIDLEMSATGPATGPPAAQQAPLGSPAGPTGQPGAQGAMGRGGWFLLLSAFMVLRK